ncbi:MAG: hypothetical protein LPK07_07805 [Hymenobacteraceae bacterium]|nr:hypothetical protein [Hymenobacteraceae bacterium]
MRNLQYGLAALCVLAIFWLCGCSTSSTPAATKTEENRSLAPQRVDIRGSIISSRYSDGQVVVEVERLAPSPYSRYDRAYVLVMPTAQIVGINGQPLSISELRQGQYVAIILRGGGQGNRVGLGVARKLWVEEAF